MNQKGNKKSLNTKKRIVEALNKLLENNNYHDLTITEICQYAEIGRASFYRNFKRKDEIVRYGINEVLNTLFKDVDDFSLLVNSGEKFYHTFIKQKDYFTFIFNNGLYVYLLQSVYSYLCKEIVGIDVYKDNIYKYTRKKEEVNDAYAMGIMAYTIIAILDVWLSRDCVEDEKSLEIIINELDTYSFHKKVEI